MRTRLNIKAAAGLALAFGACTAAPAAAKVDPAPQTSAPAIVAPAAHNVPVDAQLRAASFRKHAPSYGVPLDAATRAAFIRRHQPTYGTPSTVGEGRVGAPPRVYAVTTQSGNGFDWGDAGIGAAGGVVLSLIAMGGGLVATQRRGQGAKPAVTL